MIPFPHIILVTFAALITMVNPLAVIPSFIAMTDGTSRRLRARVAFTAGVAATSALLLFFLVGNYLFKFFGITVPAFQIMGGIIFLINGLRTLMEDEQRLRRPGAKAPQEHIPDELMVDESHAASIAVVPIGLPMLAGPGAITSVMVLVNLYPKFQQKLAVIVAIFIVGVVSWIALLAAVPISRLIGERGRLVFSKIMALLLGAIGVQFVINGLRPLIIDMLRAN